MKRIISLLLLLCMLLPASAPAEETRAPMRLLGVEEREPFWDEHPEIKTESLNDDPFADWCTLVPEMRPDLFDGDTAHLTFYKLRETGVLADLSSSQIIREATERLRPDIKALVTTEDGQILAVPYDISMWPMIWNQDAWDAAGYTEADVPQSYPELLDFLEGWIDRITEKPVKNVCTVYETCHASTDTYRDVGWLLDLLIKTQELQCTYAQEPLTFDTPEFIELLKRTRKVGLALFKAEPRMAKRKDMMQLFTDDLNEIIKLDYSFSHALPLRTSREQPALTWGFAYVLGVDAESQWKDEAIAYIEACLTDPDPYDHVGRKLLPYVDGQPGTYKVYDRFETYTENWLRDLTNYEGHFVYAPIRTYEVYYKAIKQFMEGDLSAEKLAQKISVPKLDPNI